MRLRKAKVYICSFSIIHLFFFASIVSAGTLPQFTIITEDWAPYNFQQDGVVKGISVDMLVLMLKQIGSTQGRRDIKVYPWARAYKMIQEKPDTLLFTTTRTEEREGMFKWVGPILELEFNIYALKSRNIRIDSFKDIKKYKVGTLRGDATESLLLKKTEMNIVDFDRVGSNTQNMKKLLKGRVDLIAQSKDTTASVCREMNFTPDDFEAVFTLDKKGMYYAFHKNTPDSVVAQFQAAFDELKDEGKLAEIFHRYGK